MPYHLPEHFTDLVLTLIKEYKGKHPDFHQFTNLINHLIAHLNDQPKQAEAALVSATIFALEVFEGQSWHWSYAHERKEIIRLLNQLLNLSEENHLSLAMRLYHLNRFYKIVKTHITDYDLTELSHKEFSYKGEKFWLTEEGLLKKIHDVRKVVFDKDINRINQLVYATPELLDLRNDMKALPLLYEEARKKRWAIFQNADRKKNLQLMGLIDQSFYVFYESSESLQVKQLQEDEANIRRALLLFMVLDIYNNSSWFNPPAGGYFNYGSELFKECFPMLHLPELSQLSCDERIDLLKALMTHLDKMLNNQAYLLLKQEEWKDNDASDLSKALTQFKTKVSQIKRTEEENKVTPSPTETVITKAINYVTQLALSYVCKQNVVAGIGSSLAASVSGPIVGIAVYVSGHLLLTGLAPLVIEKKITDLTAILYARILDTIGSRVGGQVSDYVTHRFSSNKEGLLDLKNQMSEEDQKEFKKWINTLLELPEDSLPEKSKHHIRRALHIDEGCKYRLFQPKFILKPHHQPKFLEREIKPNVLRRSY